jgi:hypothetical protein
VDSLLKDDDNATRLFGRNDKAMVDLDEGNSVIAQTLLLRA